VDSVTLCAQDEQDIRAGKHVGRLWKRCLACGGRLKDDFHGLGPVLPSAAMSGAPVELRVAGQTYRVVASAEKRELERLASVVDERLRSMTAPGRQVSSQALVLVAISLAHDLEIERAARQSVEARSREMLTSVLTRIDAALDEATRTDATPAPADVLAELPNPAPQLPDHDG
jgi:cell division protein ZapA